MLMRRPLHASLLLPPLAIGGGAIAGDIGGRRIDRRLRLLPEICNPPPPRPADGAPPPPPPPSRAESAIASAVEAGRLSRARRIAYECLLLHQSNAVDQQIHVSCCPSTPDGVAGAYRRSADGFLRQDNFFDHIANERAENYDIDVHSVPTECWDGRNARLSSTVVSSAFGDILSDKDVISTDNMSSGTAAIERWRWDECCSFFRTNDEGPSCFDGDNQYLCCEVAEGSDNHLILPALREPLVEVRLSSNDGQAHEIIRIEQEGSLRMFDVAGVLWPAGYLLGMCLADPVSCGVPEVMDVVDASLQTGVQPMAIELGAGVGFPSIALAKAVQRRMDKTDNGTAVCDDSNDSPVIAATDISNASLALVNSNAHINGVGNLVVAMEANHTDTASLLALPQRIGKEVQDGFDVVIGASLQALFDGTSQQSAALWQSLDALLSNANPNAVALLSHVRTGDEKITLPPESGHIFECIRRVSGDRFAMRTRDRNSSDFEVVMLKRRQA